MDSIDTVLLIGVGKMGLGMRDRWRDHRINVVGYDLNPEVTDVDTLKDLIEVQPAGHRVVWIMLIEKAYESTLDRLAELLAEGDMIVDGGNSFWKTTQARHARFAELGVHYVDVGTSGGIFGLEKGYALMIGATDDEYAALFPVLKALAPERNGLYHAGPSGAGHLAKMVHNGIEYGLMEAFAEGFNILETSDLIRDAAHLMASWRDGSIVESLLLDVFVEALKQSDLFDQLAPIAADSGEGRWTVSLATDLGVPTPVISAALMARFASQGNGDMGYRAISAMRHGFGGHFSPATENPA